MHCVTQLLTLLIINYPLRGAVLTSSVDSAKDSYEEDRTSIILLSNVLKRLHVNWSIASIFVDCDHNLYSILPASAFTNWIAPYVVLCNGGVNRIPRKLVHYKFSYPNFLFLQPAKSQYLPSASERDKRNLRLELENAHFRTFRFLQMSENSKQNFIQVSISLKADFGPRSPFEHINDSSSYRHKPESMNFVITLSLSTTQNCSLVFSWKSLETKFQNYSIIMKTIQQTTPNASSSNNKYSFLNDYVNSNSLIFISKASAEQLDSIIDPLTLASWIGIVTGYLATVIIFGTMKSITVNNFDESWYNFVMHRLIKCFYNETYPGEHNKSSGQFKHESRIKIGLKRTTQHLPLSRPKHFAVAGADVESGNCRSIVGPAASCSPTERQIEQGSPTMVNNGDDDTIGANDVHHGRPSKVILHGTIRLVSFLLIAAYEGKLYNAVTFPKSRLVTTVQDLVESGKYSVKMTKVVEADGLFNTSSNSSFHNHLETDLNTNIQNRGDHAALQICGYAKNNGHDCEPNKGSNSEMRHDKKQKQSAHPNTNKIMKNMEDCIDWMESGSKTKEKSHACVGYEFELRNLHKSHRFDTLITTKSNGNRMSFDPGKGPLDKEGVRRRQLSMSRLHKGRSTMTMGKSLQISKFPFRLMESGLRHFWSLAQNTITDSLWDETLSSSSNMFTINDNSGLTAVFGILLLISCILFVGEIITFEVTRRMPSIQILVAFFHDLLCNTPRMLRNYWVRRKKCNRVYNY